METGYSLKSHVTDWWSQGSSLQSLVYKAGDLSTTPQWLLLASQEIQFIINMDSFCGFKTVYILISWIQKKPADLDLHCFQNNGIEL